MAYRNTYVLKNTVFLVNKFFAIQYQENKLISPSLLEKIRVILWYVVFPRISHACAMVDDKSFRLISQAELMIEETGCCKTCCAYMLVRNIIGSPIMYSTTYFSKVSKLFSIDFCEYSLSEYKQRCEQVKDEREKRLLWTLCSYDDLLTRFYINISAKNSKSIFLCIFPYNTGLS